MAALSRRGTGGEREGSLVDAYSQLLHDPDPEVRQRAARNWCDWEDAHVRTHPDEPSDPRYDDPSFRLGFARLVTHYGRHAAWLKEGALLAGVQKLVGIPGVLVHGRRDLSSPLDIPWTLDRAWAGSELVIVDEAGHSGPDMTDVLICTTDRLGHTA